MIDKYINFITNIKKYKKITIYFKNTIIFVIFCMKCIHIILE